MLNRAGFAHRVTQSGRQAWRPLMAMLVVGLAACGDTSGPAAPGSIVVKTQTSGFLKPSGYNLVVPGVPAQAIGATDEVTVSGLEPGTYAVSLADVPENCTVQGAGSVDVTSNQTTQASLTVSCTYQAPASYTVTFTSHRPDLDTGDIVNCAFGFCPSQELWDMWVYKSSSTTPQSIVRPNLNAGVQIAHVAGVSLAGFNETHYAAATFSSANIETPFDAQRVILIRTDLGAVYVLGDPVEDAANQKLTFSAALIAGQ